MIILWRCGGRKLKTGHSSVSSNILIRRTFVTGHNMSTLHLKSGSPLPPFTGKLRVYNMRFCPFAQRTILVLNAKKVPYEVVYINLKDKPEWLPSKSPLGKVPALEIENNVTIYESLITAEYLDDKYPTPKLVSSDPLRKAQDKLIVENFGKVITPFYKILYKHDIDEKEIQGFFDELKMLDDELSKRATTFLGGNIPGMVDYMIWPWFERLGLISELSNDKLIINFEKYNKIKTWIEDMKMDPAVKAYYLDKETHRKYLESSMAGKPNYDMLA